MRLVRSLRAAVLVGTCGIALGVATPAHGWGLVGWGDNDYGQLGDGTSTGPESCGAQACSRAPTSVAIEAVGSFSAGYWHVLAKSSTEKIWAWGEDTFGELGNGESWDDLEEDRIHHPEHVCLLESVVCRDYGQEVNGLTGSEVQSLTAGVYYSVALMKNGTLEAWGRNTYGELGIGTSGEYQETPQPVCAPEAKTVPCTGSEVLKEVVAVSAGYWHTVALLANGKVLTWGRDDFGQLGVAPSSIATNCKSAPGEPDSNSEAPCRLVPAEVPELYDPEHPVTAIAAGWYDTLALKAGTVWSWGEDGSGQLGTGTAGLTTCGSVKCRPEPAAISAESMGGTVTAIAAGSSNGMALLESGAVRTWGHHLGNGASDATTTSAVPVAVAELANVTAVSAGEFYDMALRNDGTVFTWGANNVGLLGLNSKVEEATTPWPVPGLSEVTSISAGADSAITNGSLSTLAAKPKVTGVSPNKGSHSGGSVVEITGSNLSGASIVRFGAKAATSFTVNSATSISATVPAGEVGNVKVWVYTPGGLSATAPNYKYE
jgi:alpha-tubulin suppressor-like RCC1 family protein